MSYYASKELVDRAKARRDWWNGVGSSSIQVSTDIIEDLANATELADNTEHEAVIEQIIAMAVKPRADHIGMEDVRVVYLKEIQQVVELMRRATKPEPRASSALLEAAKAVSSLPSYKPHPDVKLEAITVSLKARSNLRQAIEAEEARGPAPEPRASSALLVASAETDDGPPCGDASAEPPDDKDKPLTRWLRYYEAFDQNMRDDALAELVRRELGRTK